jgi:hypothetical protein
MMGDFQARDRSGNTKILGKKLHIVSMRIKVWIL